MKTRPEVTMLELRRIFICFAIIGISNAFDKQSFLSSYCDDRTKGFEDYEYDCLLCRNTIIKDEDLVDFQNPSFNITNDDCVYFDNLVGAINGDFFKQFPKTRTMIFINGKISYKPPSGIGKVNNSLEDLHLQHTLIKGNETELASIFEGLPNVKLFQLRHSHFENFKNFDSGLKNILKNFKKLEKIWICGPLEEFPSGIPSSVEDIRICGPHYGKITKNDFKNLKNLKLFSSHEGYLKTVDEDAFDDLEMLETLDLEDNLLEHFSSRHLLKNKNIESVLLWPIIDVDLSDLGLWYDEESQSFSKGEETTTVKKLVEF